MLFHNSSLVHYIIHEDAVSLLKLQGVRDIEMAIWSFPILVPMIRAH
jgi:hypothetical protein